MLNSPYLYMCCTNCPGNFAHICIWSLLDFYQNITSTPLLFMSYISLWEGTGLPRNLLCSFRSFVMWVMLPLFHSSNLIVSIAETVYKMCSRKCVFIFKCIRHFDCPMVLQQNTAKATSQVIVQVGTRSRYGMLACFTSVYLDNGVETN